MNDTRTPDVKELEANIAFIKSRIIAMSDQNSWAADSLRKVLASMQARHANKLERQMGA